MKNALLLATAVAAAISMTAAAKAEDVEKCYGVAAAGGNDCQTASNSCAGQVSEAGRGDAWISVPVGTCERINGGSLEPKQS